MIKALSLSLLIIPGLVVAQDTGVNQAQLQQMMQQMQGMQACMAKLDRQQLQAVQHQAQQISAEIHALCAKGSKAEALQKASSFAKSMQANPVLQQVQNCSHGMPDMLSNLMSQLTPQANNKAGASEQDLCNALPN